MHAIDILSTELPVVKTSSTGIEVLNLLEEFRVDHLPIVNNEDFLGLIASSDVFEMAEFEEPIGSMNLSLPRLYVYGHQHVYDVIRMMHAHSLTVLPVIDEAGHYEGSVLMRGLLEYFSSLTASNNPGGIIVLEVNQNDFMLSEIARIVESDDAKILSMYIRTMLDSTKMEVTIKVNKMNILPILQTFNRFNYIIAATFTEGDTTDDLRGRYDLLMRYINI